MSEEIYNINKSNVHDVKKLVLSIIDKYLIKEKKEECHKELTALFNIISNIRYEKVEIK